MQSSTYCKHSYSTVIESSSRAAYNKGSKKLRPVFALGDKNDIRITHAKKRECKHCGKSMRYVEMRITQFKELVEAKEELEVSISNLRMQTDLQRKSIFSLKEVISAIVESNNSLEHQVRDLEQICKESEDLIESLEIQLQKKITLQQTIVENYNNLISESE
ncbi:hypothetical protein [Photobacterium leiognathi]|uniref:hypothetical protein n=1 Tax=Photobacterium leiognathi TaxID=553611 RepID=UPI002980DA5D|nr:hypothetical protein [Photobacterium leiognathi]